MGGNSVQLTESAVTMDYFLLELRRKKQSNRWSIVKMLLSSIKRTSCYNIRFFSSMFYTNTLPKILKQLFLNLNKVRIKL